MRILTERFVLSRNIARDELTLDALFCCPIVATFYSPYGDIWQIFLSSCVGLYFLLIIHSNAQPKNFKNRQMSSLTS